MQRLYRFLFSRENQNYQPIDVKLQKVAIHSTPKKLMPLNLYDELRTCVHLLENSISNNACYQDMLRKYNAYAKARFIWSTAIGLSLSGISWGIAIYIQKYFIPTLQANLYKIGEDFWGAKTHCHSAYYNHFSDELPDESIDYWNENCQSWTDQNNIDYNIHLPYEDLYDYFDLKNCELDFNSHAIEACNTQLEKRCLYGKEYFECYEPLKDLEKEMCDLQNQLNHFDGDKDPISFSIALTIHSLTSIAVIYTAFTWNRAYNTYQEELKKEHLLLDYVTDKNDLARINHLASHFKVPLENIKIEDLIITFKALAREKHQNEQRLYTFFQSHFAKELARIQPELVFNILEEAQLIPITAHCELRPGI